MFPTEPKKDFDTNTLLNEHGKDISGLGEKLGKCYSKENFQIFQEDVEKIVLKTIDSGNGRNNIKSYVVETIKEYNRDNTWEKVKFWVPTILSAIAIVATIYIASHR